MKVLSLISLGLLSLSTNAETLEGFKSERHHFGATYLKKTTEEGSESIVEFPPNGLFGDEKQYEDILDSILRDDMTLDGIDHEFAKKEAILTCEPNNQAKYFKFLPIHIGALKPDNAKVTFQNQCFKDNDITLEIVDDKTAQLVLNIKNPSSMFCADGYLFSTIINFHLENFHKRGKQVIKFKVSPNEMEMIRTQGIHVFKMCDKAKNFIPSIIKTLSMFVGGFGLDPNIPFFGAKPTKTQIKNSIDFVYQSTGYKWQERPNDELVELDEALLQSGDFLAITRFDGIDQIIQWGAGSTVGHSTMILKVNGETFVVESQAALYWPKKNIQINPYKQWIKWARNADYMVTHVPLKKEIAEKFDSEAAYKYFKSVEGTPYGFHNFIYGWIDTPDHSYPSLLDPDFMASGFAILEKLMPKAIESIYTLGMNKRLGTEGLKVAEIAVEAQKRGLTMPQLQSMVEDDAWVYPDGTSRVCSSFIIAMYKAGGLFNGIEVNGAEFTPRDLYELNFYNPNPEVPEHCKKLDPTNPFCQIMGKYRIEFPRVSTVAPYSHMNEKCWSEAPKFERIPEQC